MLSLYRSLIGLPILIVLSGVGVLGRSIHLNDIFKFPDTTRLGNSFAVVVGISDYQHIGIQDLRFANRDAEAFADWLRSKSGGSIPKDNLILLTNENATLGKVAMALDGLIANCRPGDNAVIYFSGHGDVERKTISQPGFLLAHDAPSSVYMSGGALNLRDLQEIISTLSIINQVHVLVILDACHAGRLAGTEIDGRVITTTNLMTQFANEVKILACQPNELSIEGEEWGGGRGVFSYHLIEGLIGFAEKNNDDKITLLEIGQYLENTVPTETAPNAQNPIIAGDKKAALCEIDKPTFFAYRLEKLKRNNSIYKVESKGLEDEVLAKLDSIERRIYFSFKNALISGNLLEPYEDNANSFYNILILNEKIKPLVGLMTRNFAAALIDEIQQAINAFLDNDPYEVNNWNFNPQKYSQYPYYIQRTIELLGEKHYLFASLMAKKRYFEGYNIAKTLVQFEHQSRKRDSLKKSAMLKFLEAIRYEPEAAYLYYSIGNLYANNDPPQSDSLKFWCLKAWERSPVWVIPLLEISFEYANVHYDFNTAGDYLQKAILIKPNSYHVQEKLAWLRQRQGRRNDVVSLCQKMISEKPDLFNAYSTLAFTYFRMDGNYQEAEKVALKSLELNNSILNNSYGVLSGSYLYTRRIKEAIELLEPKVKFTLDPIQINFLMSAYIRNKSYDLGFLFAENVFELNLGSSSVAELNLQLGRSSLTQNQLLEAEKYLQKSIISDTQPNPAFILAYALLGEIARIEKKPKKAKVYYLKALNYTAHSIWQEMEYKEEAFYLYGNFLLRQNRIEEALDCFLKSINLRIKGFWGEYGMALLSAKKGKIDESLDWLERSLDNFYPDSETILSEPYFKEIRKTKRFELLMSRHFR